MKFRPLRAFLPELTDSARRLPWLLAASAACGIAFLALPLFELGVPGEWVWTRHMLPDSLLTWFDRLVRPVVSAAILFFVVIRGERLVCSGGRWAVGLAVAMLVAASMLWFHGVQQSAPSPHRDVKPYWIVYDKYASGYFFEAVFRIPSGRQFLAGYADKMREGDVLHVGTHPPGLFLMSVAALDVTRSSQSLTDALDTIRSSTTESVFRQLESGAGLGRALTNSELAALQLVSLCSFLAATWMVIPVYLLTSLLSDRRTGWRAASLATLIPTIAVFYPKSDVLYPLTSMCCLWLGTLSLCGAKSIHRLLSAAAFGPMLFLSMSLSLAHLPVIVILALFAGGRAAAGGRQQLRAIWIVVTAGCGAFLATALVWNQLTQCNPFEVWQLNLTNHERFYDQSPRSWWKWLPVNLAELAFSVGLPLFVLTVAGCRQSLRGCLKSFLASDRQETTGRDCSAELFVVACLTTWLILWLSGKNMGEAARLWCFLTPWLAIAAAIGLRGWEITTNGRRSQRWKLVLVLQMATAIVTVGRVNGFHL